MKGKNHPAWKGGKVKKIGINRKKVYCKICKKKIFNKSLKRDICCSRKCYGLSRQIKVKCKNCGKEYITNKSSIKQFCSLKCSGLWTVKNLIKFKDTSIELKMERELIRNNISYEKQVNVEHIAIVDFLLSNKIIIQCDGDYWHSQKINKGRDIAQDTVLTFNGYKVYRFWEHEINKSVKNCLAKVFI